jgi:hypothetical protein
LRHCRPPGQARAAGFRRRCTQPGCERPCSGCKQRRATEPQRAGRRHAGHTGRGRTVLQACGGVLQV